MSEPTREVEALTTSLQASLTYAAAGWQVFPCHAVLPNSGGCTCGAEACGSPGKHPLVRGGLKVATTDLDQIRRWWTHWPNANVAVRTGTPSGLVVVDVDPAHGGFGSLHELIAANGLPPPTLTVETGSQGLHFYFCHPGDRIRNDAGRRLGPGLDVRGDGGYVIAPPSHHAAGRTYRWATNDELATMPDWLLQRLREPPSVKSDAGIERRIPAPVSPNCASNPWARAALAGELREIETAPEGTRNHSLNRAAFNLGQIVAGGRLEHGDTARLLIDAGMASGLSERECIATVTSGLDAGCKFPRTPRIERTTTMCDVQR